MSTGNGVASKSTGPKAAVPPDYFLISGQGPQSSTPVEKTVCTALEAEREYHAVYRMCGRSGTVTVFGPDGRTIGMDRLNTLARAEEAAAKAK